MQSKHFANSQNRLPPDEGPDGGGASTQDGEALDHDALQRLRSLDPTGDNKVIQRVVKAFEVSVIRLLPQLRNAQGVPDTNGIKHVVHTLKSSAANVGALRLSKLCVEIETMIRSEQNGDMSAMVDMLSAQVATTLTALKQVLSNRV